MKRRLIMLLTAAIMAASMVAGPVASGAFAVVDCHTRDHKKCGGSFGPPPNQDRGEQCNPGGRHCETNNPND